MSHIKRNSPDQPTYAHRQANAHARAKSVDHAKERLIVVANRLPVNLKKSPEGVWSCSMSSGTHRLLLIEILRIFSLLFRGAGGSTFCTTTRIYMDRYFTLLCDLKLANRHLGWPGSDIAAEDQETVSKLLWDDYSCIPVFLDHKLAEVRTFASLAFFFWCALFLLLFVKSSFLDFTDSLLATGLL